MEELTLAAGNVRVVVAPFGASLRRFYTVGPGGAETDWAWGYSGRAAKKGGQGDVLVPFPGRIRHGRYTFAGQAHELERNDKEGPNAIHGFVRLQDWRVEDKRPDSARFKIEIRNKPGYPFELEVTLEYRALETGFECAFALRNTGPGDAPVGAGFHPYFHVGRAPIDESELRVPAKALIEFDSGLLPTGREPRVGGTPYDFRASRAIGGTRFNHCYSQLIRDSDGLARAYLKSPETGRELVVWMDAAFKYIVIYSGDALGPDLARRALAIEPMTCATDAFNHPEWGLVVLGPGRELTGRFGVGLCSPL